MPLKLSWWDIVKSKPCICYRLMRHKQSVASTFGTSWKTLLKFFMSQSSSLPCNQKHDWYGNNIYHESANIRESIHIWLESAGNPLNAWLSLLQDTDTISLSYAFLASIEVGDHLMQEDFDCNIMISWESCQMDRAMSAPIHVVTFTHSNSVKIMIPSIVLAWHQDLHYTILSSSHTISPHFFVSWHSTSWWTQDFCTARQSLVPKTRGVSMTFSKTQHVLSKDLPKTMTMKEKHSEALSANSHIILKCLLLLNLHCMQCNATTYVYRAFCVSLTNLLHQLSW